DVGPLLAAVFVKREIEAADGAGNARGAPSVDGIAGGLAARVEIHVVRRFFGCAFAEIDEGSLAVGETDQHEAAAADVSGVGMRDGERKSDGDRSVDRIASVFQNLNDAGASVEEARPSGAEQSFEIFLATFAADGGAGLRHLLDACGTAETSTFIQ